MHRSTLGYSLIWLRLCMTHSRFVGYGKSGFPHRDFARIIDPKFFYASFVLQKFLPANRLKVYL